MFGFGEGTRKRVPMMQPQPIIHPPGSKVRLTPSVCPPFGGYRGELPPDGTLAEVIATRGDGAERVVEVLDGEHKGRRWVWDPKNLTAA